MKQLKTKFITLNVGNSNVSLATNFDSTFYQSKDQEPELSKQLQNYFKNHLDSYFLYCCVLTDEKFSLSYPAVYQTLTSFIKSNPKRVLNFLPHRKKDYFFSMPVAYAETLGSDRFTQSYLLWNQLKDEQTSYGLLIDAGTMTILDIISQDLGHLGGHILPGLKVYADMFKISDRLPAVDKIIHDLKSFSQHQDFNFIPQNTLDAISASYWQSFLPLLQNIHQKFPFKKLVISGGHGNYWQQVIKKYNFLPQCDHTYNPLYPHQAMWQIGANMLE